MKTAGVLKAICWFLVAFVLTGILFGVLAIRAVFHAADWTWDKLWSYVDGTAVDNNTVREYKELENGTFTLGEEQQITRVEIDWHHGEVTLQPAADDRLTFTETGVSDTDKRLYYKVEGNTLKIEFSKYERNVNWSKSLQVSLPASVTSLELETVEADTSIKDLTLRNFEFNTISGDLTTENLTADDLEVGTVNGAMQLSGAFRYVEGNSVNGDYTLESTICPTEIDLELVNGDLTLRIPENTGFSLYNENMLNKDFSSEFEGSITGNRFLYKNGGSEFKIEALNSDIRIEQLPAAAEAAPQTAQFAA